MEASLKEMFIQVERYVMPLINSESQIGFSNDEIRILALQHINRLNQRIGQIARSSKDRMTDMKALQTYINNLTIGVKNNNVPQMRSALRSASGFIDSLGPEGV